MRGENDSSVQNLYGKQENGRIEMTFVDLEHTGSADSRENQVVELRVPENLLYPIRDAYRTESPHGIKDFETVRNDDGTVSVFCGGSYGAKALLGAVGQLLYYGTALDELKDKS